jgi:hypothetical protein
MADQNNERSIGSRMLRDRAMAVLRETRAKIDPHILIVLKERISGLMPSVAGKAKATEQMEQQAAPIAPKKDSAFQAELKAQEKKAAKVGTDKKFIPSQKFEDVPAPDNGMEPVDRQKIAQIVLNYMKNREDGVKH